MPDNYEAEVLGNAYEAANQRGEGQDPNSIYADYMREERVKNVLSQLNPDLLVEDIEHRIRGEKKNSYSGDWENINKESPKTISSLLIENYISFLSSILNQNTSMSNYTIQEINNLMSMVVEHLRDDLSDNCEEYGFTKVDSYGNVTVDYNEMTRIGMIICGTTFSVLKRAQGGTEARRVFGALRMTENMSAQQPKKGWADFLKFWN